jgi:hypothetical protein
LRGIGLRLGGRERQSGEPDGERCRNRDWADTHGGLLAWTLRTKTSECCPTREGEEAYPVLRGRARAEEIRHHWRGLSFMALWVLAGRYGSDWHARLFGARSRGTLFLSFRHPAAAAGWPASPGGDRPARLGCATLPASRDNRAGRPRVSRGALTGCQSSLPSAPFLSVGAKRRLSELSCFGKVSGAPRGNRAKSLRAVFHPSFGIPRSARIASGVSRT